MLSIVRSVVKKVTVKQTDLFINPVFPYLGASPDGLVTDVTSPDPNGILEIKCPFKYRNLDPVEAARNKGFCCDLKQHLKNSIVIITKFKDRWP